MPQAYERLSNDEIIQYETRRREEVERKTTEHRSLSLLSIGQEVYVQDHKTSRWKFKGTIVGIRNRSRSYYVMVDGRRKLRNRRFLRPIEELEKSEGPCSKIQLDKSERLHSAFDQVEEPAAEAQSIRRSTRRKKKIIHYES